MKKLILLLFAVCSLVFAMNVYAEDTYNEDNYRKFLVDGFKTDFSNGETFFKSAKDSLAPDAVEVVDFDSEEGGHGKVLKITNSKSAYKSEATQKGFGSKEQSVAVFEHDWYFTSEGEDESSWKHIINGSKGEFVPFKYNDSGGWGLKFNLANDGKLTIKDSITGATHTIAQLEFDKWIHVKFVFDLRTDTISTYVDGVPTAQNVRFVSATADIKYIQYFAMKLYVDGTSNLYHWYVDNAEHYLLYPKYTVEEVYEAADGSACTDDGILPYDYLKIRLKFSEIMKTETVISSNFVLKDGNGNVIPYVGEYNEAENEYVIVLDNVLSPDSEYSLDISDAVVTGKNAVNISTEPIKFYTKKPPVGIEAVTIDKGSLLEYEPGSEAEITVELRDELLTSPDVRIIAGIYDDMFMSVSINVCEAKAIKTGDLCKLSLKVPENVSNGNYSINVIMVAGGDIWNPYDSCNVQ